MHSYLLIGINKTEKRTNRVKSEKISFIVYISRNQNGTMDYTSVYIIIFLREI